MEDILAIILVLAGVALATLAIRMFLRRSAEKAALEAEERARQIEATRKWRESMRTKMSTPPPPKSAPSTPSPSYTTTRATSTTTTTSSDDGFMTGMLTGMLIDNAINSISHKSEPSIGVSKTESSWGFDDSDSRKSISSSMDTSSSWSSSSDSYSSSDSGPSSDW